MRMIAACTRIATGTLAAIVAGLPFARHPVIYALPNYYPKCALSLGEHKL